MTINIKIIRKIPVEVEGFQLEQEMLNHIKDSIVFTKQKRRVIAKQNHFIIETLEGDMRAEVGDWIIIGVEGEIYSCRSDIFKKTYVIMLPERKHKKLKEDKEI